MWLVDSECVNIVTENFLLGTLTISIGLYTASVDWLATCNTFHRLPSPNRRLMMSYITKKKRGADLCILIIIAKKLRYFFIYRSFLHKSSYRKKTYLTNYIFFIKNEGVGGLLLLTSILQLKSANSVVSSAAFARSFTHKSGDFHTYYLCFVSASRKFLLLNIHELTSNRSALLQRH